MKTTLTIIVFSVLSILFTAYSIGYWDAKSEEREPIKETGTTKITHISILNQATYDSILPKMNTLYIINEKYHKELRMTIKEHNEYWEEKESTPILILI